MLDIRPVLFVNGILLLILAAAMAFPVGADIFAGQHERYAFAAGAFIAGYLGLTLVLSGRGPRRLALPTREAFLLAVSSWLLVAAVAAVPFMLGSLHLSPVDAFFESMSGLTTTGATVLRGLDHAPHAVLMWRAMLNWLGGVGIIMTAVTILPSLRIGGMQLFRMESSDKSEQVVPRFKQVAWGVLTVYSLFTVLLACGLMLAGMTPLEAVCHAMSSISTGGFSTSDRSLGAFSDGARWIAVLGMVVGGGTFSLYVRPWSRHGGWALLKDSQLRWYLSTMLFFSLLLTFWNWAVKNMPAYEALRASTFNVVAMLTTTGFFSNDYDRWGHFAEVVFFMLAFVGGCTGSSAGGIKVFRYEVLFAMVRQQARRLLHPHGVFVIRFNGRVVDDMALRSVLTFVMFYFFAFAALALALTMTGLDALTSLSASASAMGNVGPGLGPLVGPGHGYGAVPLAAKVLLTGGMLLGRLEVATVLVLLTRGFWRE